MPIQDSSTLFHAGQRFAGNDGFASGGMADLHAGMAYMQGQREGAAAAAQALNDGPRIFSPDVTQSGAGGAGGDGGPSGSDGGDNAAASDGKCAGGKCSSGGGGDTGQILQQLLQALAPMASAIAPMLGGGMMSGLGGGSAT